MTKSVLYVWKLSPLNRKMNVAVFFLVVLCTEASKSREKEKRLEIKRWILFIDHLNQRCCDANVRTLHDFIRRRKNIWLAAHQNRSSTVLRTYTYTIYVFQQYFPMQFQLILYSLCGASPRCTSRFITIFQHRALFFSAEANERFF